MELIGGTNIERMGREIPRVAARYPVNLQVTWYLPKSRLSLRPRSVDARMIDLSLAGAAIELPSNSRTEVGAQGVFELSNRRGQVQVRYVSHPPGNPSRMHLGVAFVRLDDELRDAINRFVDHQSELRLGGRGV